MNDNAKTSAASTPATRAPTVLVVDDDPNSLRMLCDALEDQGYTVLIATSGETALQRLQHVMPDAILLDGVMPGLSGFETCQRIKAAPQHAHIPVLFMTGLADTPDIVRGFESGGVDYVVKPIRIEEVLARLARHTHNARMARMAREAVDVAGMGVLIMDHMGHIVWQSPTAALWLERLARAHGSSQRPRIPSDWLERLQTEDRFECPLESQLRLRVRNTAAPGSAEAMLILTLLNSDAGSPLVNETSNRLSNAALTPRETEVLSWVAKGKTNRDIADILGLSPRTVNKHLEHVFEKLGVETRAAAAALASRELPDG
ncbi:response regulator transcription factor [Lampropedia puyangensis]|uniref:Response regulator transcription factor n=1 Tax=Lampropedia puyangensis TaxID=1330072 RepID=A0A4S8FAE9_9BURK|nr:response regulator transcription factor [Lampropedia puyangensis]THU04480.1 response regulator transcription factor [Lampropedia puyangensis]